MCGRSPVCEAAASGEDVSKLRPFKRALCACRALSLFVCEHL